jgi:hypothetical protein
VFQALTHSQTPSWQINQTVPIDNRGGGVAGGPNFSQDGKLRKLHIQDQGLQEHTKEGKTEINVYNSKESSSYVKYNDS